MKRPELPAIQRLVDEAKDHLATLIAYDTVSKNSNRELIDHMASYFETLGGALTIIPDKTG
eukprot:CAMPEP_0184425076 /NCGR_PEP_ID=MMETSP0738-20130409/124743_1 /TAXON_ID=385413 /ORGANISM="Thalassiosira miniscula, Strain CCMP1093" /LENGTH=60 /DNA_ID=CAMNT_0026787785 /DNA_START=32 /DNA_END=211 /DNA_ORIENTATION=+